MKIPQKVSIIMATYNGLEHLRGCLPSLFNCNYPNFELIIVDNNSKDNSEDFVKKNYPQVKYIKENKNHGYAGGNNIGLNYADGDFILFLNNDTKVDKNFISEMVNALNKNNDLGGVQSKVLLMDDPRFLDSVGSYFTNTGFLYHYGANKKDEKKYNKKIYIYSAKGVCMMFRKDKIKEVLVDGEIFDGSYFAYFEETDMCHRIWLAGSKIGYVPSSLIYHKTGGTSKKMNNAFIQYHSFKNRINSYLKNLSLKKLIYLIPIHIILCELNALISLFKGNFQMFLAIHKAIYWNILQAPETLRKRKYIQQNIRKIRDDDFLPFISKNVGLDYYFNLFSGLRSYKEKEITLVYSDK